MILTKFKYESLVSFEPLSKPVTSVLKGIKNTYYASHLSTTHRLSDGVIDQWVIVSLYIQTSISCGNELRQAHSAHLFVSESPCVWSIHTSKQGWRHCDRPSTVKTNFDRVRENGRVRRFGVRDWWIRYTRRWWSRSHVGGGGSHGACGMTT